MLAAQAENRSHYMLYRRPGAGAYPSYVLSEYARHGFEVPYRDDDREVLAANLVDFRLVFVLLGARRKKRMRKVSSIRTFFARRLIRI